jgi:uncharacterized membrane protein (DUF485 family)
MLGWLGGLFGLFQGNQTAASLAKDVSNGVDMLIYTDEEKAIAQKEAFVSWLKMVELMKDSETYRSVTRRILAVTIIMNLLLMIWLCIIAETLAFFKLFGMVPPVGQPFTPITMAIIQVAGVFQLGWVFCTIIVFYFGPHLIQFFSKGK